MSAENLALLQGVFKRLATATYSARDVPYEDVHTLPERYYLREVYSAACDYVRAFEQWDDERRELENENPSACTLPVSTSSTQSDPSTQVDSPAHAAKKRGLSVALDGSEDGSEEP